MQGIDEPRLTVELVPATQWGANLRAVLSRSAWAKCQQYAKEQSGSACGICAGVGKNGRLECHERWEFDDTGPVQRLVGLNAPCPRCHLVKHFGRALVHGFEQDAVTQLRQVNGSSHAQVVVHAEAAAAAVEAAQRAHLAA